MNLSVTPATQRRRCYASFEDLSILAKQHSSSSRRRKQRTFGKKNLLTAKFRCITRAETEHKGYPNVPPFCLPASTQLPRKPIRRSLPPPDYILTEPTHPSSSSASSCKSSSSKLPARSSLMLSPAPPPFMTAAVPGSHRSAEIRPIYLPGFFRPRPYDPNRFVAKTTIARALHGEVRGVKDKRTNKRVVLKVVPTVANHRRPSGELESPFVEICVMNYLYSSVAVTPPLFIVGLEDTLQDDKCTYLVQECCEGGELFDYLRTYQTLTEAEIRTVALQLIFALLSLHINGICHRDVSLENVLLADDFSIRLIDFGQADTLLDNFGNPKLAVGNAGKVYYRAPEMYIGPYFGRPVDVFALGVLLFILLSGTPPWDEAVPSDDNYRTMISSKHAVGHSLNRIMRKPPSLPLIDLLTAILYKPAAARPTLEEILQHPWIADDPTVWSKTLAIHPESDLILEHLAIIQSGRRQALFMPPDDPDDFDIFRMSTLSYIPSETSTTRSQRRRHPPHHQGQTLRRSMDIQRSSAGDHSRVSNRQRQTSWLPFTASEDEELDDECDSVAESASDDYDNWRPWGGCDRARSDHVGPASNMKLLHDTLPPL